jgi:hypothetical protein
LKRAGETTSASITQHTLQSDAHFQPTMTELRPGCFIPDLPFYGYGTYTPTGENLLAGLFLAAYEVNIASLGVYIATPASEGKSLRLGIYRARADLYPEGLKLDAGLIAASGSGFKTLTVNHHLKRGYYYLAVHMEESCELRYVKLAQSPLGMYSSLNAVYSGYGSAAEWGALPAKFPRNAMLSNVMKVAVAITMEAL